MSQRFNRSFLRAWCQRWSNKAEYIKTLGQELARRSNIWNLQSAFFYGQKMTEILPIKSKMTRWVVAGLLTSYCERFEPRSHFKGRLSLIVRVNVVLNSTVVVDSDYVDPDDQAHSTFEMTPGFKPFTITCVSLSWSHSSQYSSNCNPKCIGSHIV